MAFMEQCREGVRDVGTPTLEAFFELFRDSEPHLRLVDVALSSLSRELARSPEKREVLCEVIYSFTQEAWEPVSSCFWMHFGP